MRLNQINYILSSKKECVINIVNDKLTLSVFSLLEKNLKNVKEINLDIRQDKLTISALFSQCSRPFPIQLILSSSCVTTYWSHLEKKHFET